MIILQILVGVLVIVAFGKMFQFGQLSAEIAGKQPNFFVRAFFGSLNFVSDLVSLKIFK